MLPSAGENGDTQSVLEKIVHNAWVRWSYVLVIAALHVFLLAPFTRPSEAQLLSCLETAMQQGIQAEFNRVPKNQQAKWLQVACDGASLNSCTSSWVRQNYTYDEGYHWRSIIASVGLDMYLECTGSFHLAQCAHGLYPRKPSIQSFGTLCLSGFFE
jgi:hypothetical protein